MKQVFSAAVAALMLAAITHAAPAPSNVDEAVQYEALDFTPYKNIPPPPGFNAEPHNAAAAISVPFEFKNNLDSSKVKLYMTFQPAGQAGISFIGPDGKVFHPTAQGTIDNSKIEHSVKGGKGSTYKFTLKTGFNSGRVYISDGSMKWVVNDAGQTAAPAAENSADPNYKVNWGFLEVNVGDDASVFGNLSFVDFVGLIIGAKLSSASNTNQVVPGMPADGVSQLCKLLSGLPDQDKNPWGSLCVQKGLRTLSPNKAKAPKGLSTYFDSFITKVFDRFSKEDLILYDDADQKNHTARVKSGKLVVDGYGWSKPKTTDIYSCNDGPFANPSGNPTTAFIDPILCAAFNRGTLLQKAGNYQINGPNEKAYYTSDTYNQYAKFVHQLELDHRGYALQYDEPHPAGQAEVAGTFQAAAGEKINSLQISIGAPFK